MSTTTHKMLGSPTGNPEAAKNIINKKVIDFFELKNAKIHADSLEKTVISKKELSQHDPLHGVYVYAQNKISVLVEQLAELPTLS